MNTFKYCFQCKSAKSRTDTYCWNDGDRLVTSMNICNRCGKEEGGTVTYLDKFCRRCGGKMEVRSVSELEDSDAKLP